MKKLKQPPFVSGTLFPKKAICRHKNSPLNFRLLLRRSRMLGKNKEVIHFFADIYVTLFNPFTFVY